MDWWSFGLLFNNNVGLYICVLAGSLLLYYLLYRKIIISILDPIIFMLLFSVFGFSVVIFLYLTNSIETKYLVSYLLTQSAFAGGFFTFRNLNKRSIMSPFTKTSFESEVTLLNITFLVFSGLYLIIQLISYLVIGIPLLLGTHIDLYTGSGGLGILGHILDVIKPVSIFLLIYYLLNPTTSLFIYIYKYVFLVFILLFSALSGSKSEFMNLGFIFFCFIILNGHKLKIYINNLRRYELRIILAALGFVFFTILFQLKTQDNDVSGLYVFIFRLVSSGDTYFFAYPNHVIETLNSSKPFLALFGDIFSTLRIIPRENQPMVLGFQLYNKFFSDSDIIVGPNARHNVFGYVYFGFYGSIIFSYLLGLVLSFTRNKAFFSFRKNIFGQIIFTLVYLNLTLIESDPPLVISNLENIMLILPVFLFISFCIFFALMKTTKPALI